MSGRFTFDSLERSCIELASYSFPRNVGEALKTMKVAEQRGGPVDRELEALRRAVEVNGEPTPEQWRAMHAAYLGAVSEQRERDVTPAVDVSTALWGSKRQFMFGKVVVDVLFERNVHPVFGILLRPTGGGIGPGSNNWDLTQALQSPVAKILGGLAIIDVPRLGDGVVHHAAVHDAGGYLKRSFNKGPGYTYAHATLGWYDWLSVSLRGLFQTTLWSGTEPSRDMLRGQVSGIVFWYTLFGKNPTLKRD
jgi:hypothetical protein